MTKPVHNHATIRPNGNVYIPPSFMENNGWTSREKLTFTGSEDGMSFTIKLGEGKINIANGNCRIGIDLGSKMVRGLMKNKAVSYPYVYKGVYELKMIDDSTIEGTLVEHQVPNISLAT